MCESVTEGVLQAVSLPLWGLKHPLCCFCPRQQSNPCSKWPPVCAGDKELFWGGCVWQSLSKMAGPRLKAQWTVPRCHFSLTEPWRYEPQLSGQLNSLCLSRCCPNLLRLAAYVAHLHVLAPSVCVCVQSQPLPQVFRLLPHWHPMIHSVFGRKRFEFRTGGCSLDVPAPVS